MNNGTIYLIGMMGSGKTTVGKLLAEKMEIPFVNIDSVIEKEQVQTISQLFYSDGETHFRNLETEALKSASDCVVACGGGVVLRRENRALIRSHGTVILLTASMSELSKRTTSLDSRPLMNGPIERVKALEQLWEERRNRYTESAHFSIDTEVRTPKEVCQRILERVGNADS
ncbi:MAG: shikimate kinase [Candidatus Neomarinimicrobiota bacterium]|nr:shikimate kinase [Candidatus Neomarinimicrobiota bacterium]